MDSVINFKIMSNPINWFIVLLMLLFAGVAVDICKRGVDSLKSTTAVAVSA